MADETTLLVITGMGVPPYSARGLTQTLEPIAAAANYRRTVNGELVDLSAPQFRKYKSTIAGSDLDPPALGSRWPGMVVEIDCIAEIPFLTASEAPERPVVAGSERVEGDFTFYRPHLRFMITGFTVTVDEYGASTSWQLELEEV